MATYRALISSVAPFQLFFYVSFQWILVLGAALWLALARPARERVWETKVAGFRTGSGRALFFMVRSPFRYGQSTSQGSGFQRIDSHIFLNLRGGILPSEWTDRGAILSFYQILSMLSWYKYIHFNVKFVWLEHQCKPWTFMGIWLQIHQL